MNSFFNSVKDVLSQIAFIPNDELKLAIIGGIVTIVFFLIAMLISAGSKINGLRKKLFKFITKIANMDKIDESNVDEVYAGMSSLPEPISKGWGRFLDQGIGYPSDYIVTRDCIGGEYEGKRTAGKAVFVVLSIVLWAALAFVTAGVCAADLSRFGFADIVKNFGAVASILSVVLVPVAVFAVLLWALNVHYFKQRKRLELCFASLQDALDEKVVVKEREAKAYDSESLDDIAEKVKALTDGRMEDGETIEVTALPDGIEEEKPEEPEETEEEKPAPVDDGIGDIEYPSEEDEEETGTTEPVAEEPVVEETEPVIEEAAEPVVEERDEKEAPPIILTKEEEERYLSVLPVVVEQAIADPDTTKGDLEELAEMIENARVNNFDDPADQAILVDCLQKIADKYYA